MANYANIFVYSNLNSFSTFCDVYVTKIKFSEHDFKFMIIMRILSKIFSGKED